MDSIFDGMSDELEGALLDSPRAEKSFENQQLHIGTIISHKSWFCLHFFLLADEVFSFYTEGVFVRIAD